MVSSAVERTCRARVDDAERVGLVAMVSFDETVVQPPIADGGLAS